MNFTAIDFETATSGYNGVCSLGWCIVKNGEIIDRKEILIKPEPFEFNPYNIKIHGITPEMVWDKPTFDEYWEYIKGDIENQFIVAHNASFDVNVLCRTLEHYGIEFPEFDYLCTVQLSQKAYPELESHKLNNLCDALGMTFNHHRAYDDAYACAKVLLRIAHDYSLTTIDEIKECFDVNCGSIYPGMELAAKKKKTIRRKRSTSKTKAVQI